MFFLSLDIIIAIPLLFYIIIISLVFFYRRLLVWADMNSLFQCIFFRRHYLLSFN